MFELYQHQKVALAHLRMHNEFALFMEQGTGKTLTVLSRIAELLESGKAHTALIVCPKAVMGSWERDCGKFEPETAKRLREGLTVINYDKIWRRDEYRKHWDIIVLDESHKIKSHTTRRGKCLLEMALDSDYRYILTGTPISNGQLENIWAQFAFLKPYVSRGRVYSEIFGGSYYNWLDRYAFLDQWHKPYRYRFVDELQDIINQYSYRVTKAECLDLPDKLPEEMWDIELLDKKRYRELHKDSTISDMDVLAENALARMTKLRQFCSGWVGTDSGDMEVKCEKVEALNDFLDGYGDKKLAIFCEFRRSIDTVCGVLEKRGIKHVVLDGRTEDKSVWKLFQTEPEIQVIVCQYQSANAGIDLYAADTMLFYEPTLSSNVYEQSKDRIHRIGQRSKCSYVCFRTKGTIEGYIYNALRGYADFGVKLFTQYMKEYQKGGKS